MIAEQFPSELAARANGGLNLLHFVWAFIAQYGTGLVVAQWTPQDAHYPAIAYQIAFAMNVVAQVMALAWFVFPRPRIWLSSLATSFLVQSEGQGSLIEVAVSPTETAVMESGEGAEW
jgi:hypothetical protein